MFCKFPEILVILTDIRGTKANLSFGRLSYKIELLNFEMFRCGKTLVGGSFVSLLLQDV